MSRKSEAITATAGAAVLLSVVFLATNPAASATPSPADRTLVDFKSHTATSKVLTAAHRGQWRKAPENSLKGVTAAYSDGAEIAEVDVRYTKDRHAVLMHDETVDRTTNGKGRVKDLTYAQIQTLKLRQGLGGASAPLTNERVPTLASVMNVAKTRGLVNLDKGWPEREAIYSVLKSTGTVNRGVFKDATGTPVTEANAFRTRHPDALYMAMLSDNNPNKVAQFGTRQPLAYEVIFDKTTAKVAQPAYIKGLKSKARIWLDTMWAGMTGPYVDNANGWNAAITTYGGSVIQTDNVVAFESWVR